MTDSIVNSQVVIGDATIEEEQPALCEGGDRVGDQNDVSTTCCMPPYVLKKPHANSKLILQNMEEVLNSVKKKHRQKHRRKREQKKLAQMEALAAASSASTAEMESRSASAEEEEANGSGDGTTVSHKDDISRKHGKHQSHHRRRHKKSARSLQEQIAVQENGMSPSKKCSSQHGERKSPLKGVSTSVNNTILKHFPRTPSKGDKDDRQQQPQQVDGACQVIEVMDDDVKPAVKATTTTTTTNVFELMMNARNKTIGSNTPGLEATATGDELNETSPNAQAKVQRKLMLQQWADKKGGAKRRLDDEQRAEYVDLKLDQRSKRFKRMLLNSNENGISCSSTPKTSSDTRRQAKKAPPKSGEPTENGVTISKLRTRMPRGRVRRLSSAESIESAATPPPGVDAEAMEFLAKLSSPTKKRDSLLGYFPKKASPKELAEAAAASAAKAASTPKTHGRRSTKSAANSGRRSQANGVDGAVDAVAADAVQSTPRGRPKRSCAGKTQTARCHDDEADDGSGGGTPVKSVGKATRRAAKRRSSQHNGEGDTSDVEIICLDESNASSSAATPNGSAATPSTKLAPLFTRRSVPVPKPKSVDAAMLRARQEFLMSGVPEKIRLEKARRREFEQTYEEAFEPFPKVSHVLQWSPNECVLMRRGAPARRGYKLLPSDDEDDTTTTNGNGIVIGGGRRGKTSRARGGAAAGGVDCVANKAARVLAHYRALPPIANRCAIIKTWKVAYDIFPTYKCFNQMREKYRYFSAVDGGQATQQVTESFVVTRRTRRSAEAQRCLDGPDATEAQPPMAAPNGELLFTEKYRPMMLEQVLVNLLPVTRLREYLASWTHGSARNSQGLADNSMDFINDSNSSQMATGGNTMVLLGPVSSGKTSAVFALANEMNFNVLEINAGMKRTGKKLIQELQEATQSHQIAKEPSAACQTKAQKNLLKLSLNGGMRAKGKRQLSSSSSQSLCDDDGSGGGGGGGGGGVGGESPGAELGQSARKCLILIEDADIVFEQHDAGFTDAIYTLAASSKRPVIVVATNPNCAHLQRLIQQNKITFNAPNTLNTSRFLSVLALIENCPMRLEDIISLYLYNGKDLRKTLLELQFFIQSGGDLGRLEHVPPALRTPPKRGAGQQPVEPQSPKFFASPSKRRFSVEANAEHDATDGAGGGASDEQLQSTATTTTTTTHQVAASGKRSGAVGETGVSVGGDAGDAGVYQHTTLFQFYSQSQNQEWRVPLPVDFRLLAVNLGELLKAASTLQPQAQGVTTTTNNNNNNNRVSNGKRRTRSPKKPTKATPTKPNASNGGAPPPPPPPPPPPLECLARFYENISVAALLDGQWSDQPTAMAEAPVRDRLVAYPAEGMAHELVERSIAVHLAAPPCDYNLFDEPEQRPVALTNLLWGSSGGGSGGGFPRSKRANALDYEPMLREICRSERLRAAQERRSTRFYHYLRNSAGNMSSFSTKPFDAACNILQLSLESNDK